MAREPGHLRAHVNQRVSAVTGRLDQHKIALGLVVAAAGLFLAYIAWVSVDGPPFQSRYRLTAIVPKDAPILKRGDAVRVAGRLAGFITAVDPDSEQEAVRVDMNIRPQFAPIGADARANVRVKSLVYLTYLEIFPGDTSNPLPDGGTIPLDRVTSGTDLLEVVQLFNKQTRRTLQNTLVSAGYGVAGRGEELNIALGQIRPTFESGTPELQAATSEEGAIADIVGGASKTTSGLTGERPDDVKALIGSTSAFSGAVANHTTELGEAIRLLRPFEDQFLQTAPVADPLLNDAAALSVELTPAVRKLNQGLPQLDRLLGLGTELRTETARIAAVTNPVLRAERPLLVALYPAAAALDPLLTDLATVVDVIDPYEADIRAAGKGLTAVTSIFYPQGQTAPDNPALRFTPIITCHNARDPFPAPGKSLEDKQSC